MTHPEYSSNSDVFPTLTHANYCVVIFVALMLKTQSDLDFFKIFKFCKNLGLGQYFPYQILKTIGKLSVSSENGQNYE